MLKSRITLAILWFGALTLAVGQDSTQIELKSYSAQRTKRAPQIDGDITDQVWDAAEWGSGFRQIQPYDGDPPTNETSFKILYDDVNLYIAFRCFDDDPDAIVSRMSRRDGFAGDWVEVNIDSYHDKRTAFSFTSSVSGVRGDEFVSDDGNNWDASWNPIWEQKAQIDSLGWSSEVRIPLSQLRFGSDEEQVWGVQFTRRDFRNESRSVWQYVPNNAGYWVSGFGELLGIKNIKPKRQIEIQPYVLGQVDVYKGEAGNPYADGTDLEGNIGVDGKIGLTNDITLDFTVNPDFGQVEADPSVLTLDGYRIFFSERRPFFIENRNLFQFGISESIAGGSYDADDLFYSRRIGAQPHHGVSGDSENSIYVDQPDFTTILGAAKVSGKTKNGLSLGILESVTAQEWATISSETGETEELVEPLTNYFVARASQDFKEGKTVIGGIVTNVQRRIEVPELNFLRKSATSGGIDFLHRWKDRAWRLDGKFVFSKVAGDQLAISNTQLAFEHYFNRPDAKHFAYDSTRTSLTGTGGNLAIGNYSGEFNFQTGVTYRSPELELNDIGFMLAADEINYYYWMGYRENEPTERFRTWGVNYNHWARWDFGGRNLYRAVNMNTNMQFQNFWSFGFGGTYENLDISNNWLRGGPAYRRSSGLGHWIWLSTDRRKVVSFNVFYNGGYGFDYKVRFNSISPRMSIQATDALNFSIQPRWARSNRLDQYITTESFAGENRYILGEVLQQTLSFTLRLNYNIKPDLTIQYYGQPFVSRGEYHGFNHVIDPLARDFDDRVHFYTEGQINLKDDTFYIDENMDGNTDYSFGQPDFNFVQYRSNLVVRWEYIPGSEAFFVWTQGNTDFGQPDFNENLFKSLSDGLFSEGIRNIFLIKLAYRFINK